MPRQENVDQQIYLVGNEFRDKWCAQGRRWFRQRSRDERRLRRVRIVRLRQGTVPIIAYEIKGTLP